MDHPNFLSILRWLQIFDYFFDDCHDFNQHLIWWASENDLSIHFTVSSHRWPLQIHPIFLIEADEDIFNPVIETGFLYPGVVNIPVCISDEDISRSHNLIQIQPVDMIQGIVVIFDHVQNVDDSKTEPPSKTTHMASSTEAGEINLLIYLSDGGLDFFSLHLGILRGYGRMHDFIIFWLE